MTRPIPRDPRRRLCATAPLEAQRGRFSCRWPRCASVVRVLVVLAIAHGSAFAQSWNPPRTPWGDPDLQGNYSNKYEQGTPFERPAEFEGRRLADIAGTELAAIIRQRAAEVLLNAPFTGGDPVAGNFGGAPAFYDRFEAAKGSRPWFVTDQTDGRIPAMSPEGQKASAARAAARAALRRGRGPADSFTDRSLYDRCITRGLPGSMMPANYGNSYRIVQSPGYVAITYEMVHETRLIPLDARPALGTTFRHYMGEPRGHWEGNTLVVTTTNFRDDQAYRGANPETVRFIERFTATSADKLEWSFTVDDPTTWTRPWTFAMPLTRNDDEAVLEYACHEGNLAMPHLLSAARAEEKAIAEGRLTRPAAGARGGRGGGDAGGDADDDGPRPAAAAAASAPPARTSASPVATGTASGLSGSWVIDRNRSGRGNFAGLAPPGRLEIAQRATETSVATDTGTENQLQTAVYRHDGAETEAPGPLGWETRARASMQDGTLVVNVKRSIDGPDGKLTFEIKDVYTVSADTLTLERTQGSRSQKLVYTRP
jgi:hypothetical protein